MNDTPDETFNGAELSQSVLARDWNSSEERGFAVADSSGFVAVDDHFTTGFAFSTMPSFVITSFSPETPSSSGCRAISSRSNRTGTVFGFFGCCPHKFELSAPLVAVSTRESKMIKC